MRIEDINRDTPEGRLLWITIIKMSTELYTSLTPDEILDMLEKEAQRLEMIQKFSNF